jgi:hypothetical protein
MCASDICISANRLHDRWWRRFLSVSPLISVFCKLNRPIYRHVLVGNFGREPDWEPQLGTPIRVRYLCILSRFDRLAMMFIPDPIPMQKFGPWRLTRSRSLPWALHPDQIPTCYMSSKHRLSGWVFLTDEQPCPLYLAGLFIGQKNPTAYKQVYGYCCRNRYITLWHLVILTEATQIQSFVNWKSHRSKSVV